MKYKEVFEEFEESLNECLMEFVDCDGDMESEEFKDLYKKLMEYREKRKEFFGY